MKALLFVCVILAMVLVLTEFTTGTSACENGLPNGTISSRKTKAFRRICKQKVRKSCTSSSLSCGRYGRSRAYMCQLFKNDCERLIENCNGLNKYRKVSRNLCTGMTVGRQSVCGSGLSPTINSSNTRVIYE